jgi:hypothetical protein
MPDETLWESMKRWLAQGTLGTRFVPGLRWRGGEMTLLPTREPREPRGRAGANGGKSTATDGRATGTEQVRVTERSRVDEDAADTEDDRFAPPHREARSLKRTLLMVSDSLERSQLADYVQLLNTPKRLIYLNLLAGLFRGVGMAIGFTLLTAVIIYIMTRSFVANLPVVGDFLGELVWIIQQYLRGKS